ncbi:MAG TPA: MMPL family transporter [Conexibacter sp.]|jgi:RND superfamily putative drug exporter|nr:MMPL family transporter [Conexibacter sp.]
MTSNNFAARAGRWSARHRKAAVLGWIAFVLTAFALGNIVVGTSSSSDDNGPGESGRAERILSGAFPDHATETVLVSSRAARASDPAFRAAVGDVVQRMRWNPQVLKVDSPYAPGNDGQIAPSDRAAVVTLELRRDVEETDVKPLLAATAAAQRAHPDLRIEQFGDASADEAISKMFSDDFKKAEVLSVPITLAILVVAFGAFVAAGIPLLLALSSVMATLGLVAIGSHVIPVEDSVGSVVLLIGLAVGVDYSLFYLRREREERAAGRSEEAALEAAAATSGRAVLISGLTVMIAMAGMFIAGSSTFTAMAMGAILVVGVSLVASLTVLPAVLSKLGDRVERGRIPLLMRRRNVNGGAAARAWGAMIDAVLRRPLASLVVAGGLLLALCLPVLGMRTALPGTDSLPRSLPVMQTYDRIQAAFPGKEIAATVAVESDAVSTPTGRAAIADLRRRALASGVVNDPITVDVAKNGRVASIDLPIDGDGANAASKHALDVIRGELTPALRADLPDGATVAVTGMTAETADFNTLMSSRLPLVFAFVLTLAFLLLLVTFRSVVIAAKAIALNLLSVGAAYGLLVLVFQHGWGESLLDFRSTGAITSWLPLFLFVVLFGLSMDYHVFILSRVREAYDRGMSTNDAIRHGIKSTAGTVTSAAIIMVAVFGVFATLSAVEFKQMGVGLAAAILIDATIVRAVLLPAAMTLLGERNWYLPRWLEWLPRVGPERGVEPLPAPVEPRREPEPARAF